MLYISTKFCEIIFERYQTYRADTISIPKISKGNNSAKNVGGVTVVNLCTSSDRALHLCQVSLNHLERYQSYGPDTNVQPLTDGRTDGRTDTQKFGGYNIIPRHFLWRGIKMAINLNCLCCPVKCLQAVCKEFFIPVTDICVA